MTTRTSAEVIPKNCTSSSLTLLGEVEGGAVVVTVTVGAGEGSAGAVVVGDGEAVEVGSVVGSGVTVSGTSTSFKFPSCATEDAAGEIGSSSSAGIEAEKPESSVEVIHYRPPKFR
jgi:hypothetical protein